MSDSDAALVARVVLHDDRAAFELLVRRYQAPVRGFLRRLVRNDAARADDLAQETFMKLYRSINTYKAQARFSTWLYRIAHNAFLNDQRGRVAETQFDEGMHSGNVDSTLSAGNEADLEVAIQTLSDHQRAVFDLYYGKGMTHEETAAALEMPLGTVKSHLSRGLETLRQIFRPGEKC